MSDRSRCGWDSDFPSFQRTASQLVRDRLLDFVRDASPEQVRAWDTSIPALQREVGEVVACDRDAGRYVAILEYELPLESRRPDAVFLVRGSVAVLELKGKAEPSQADLDQAAAYARDLRCYHRACAERPVIPVVVPTRARGHAGEHNGVQVLGPDALDAFMTRLEWCNRGHPLGIDEFLDREAYCPLPTIVQAARELFQQKRVRHVARARAATEPAIDAITRICHEAATTRTRRLVVLTGVPGAGKTLVGLTIAHSDFLDDLAVGRSGGKPSAPAVFLSGNGALVEVLQYELRDAGAGKTFVRGVKDYVKYYSSRPDREPPEHVLVFDEAQRAFDAVQVEQKHAGTPGFAAGLSEPEHFIEFASRVREWCVVVCLVGGGQEIHVGEEAGLVQWRHAVERAPCPREWRVHGPPALRSTFTEANVVLEVDPSLSLDVELRYHLTRDLTALVKGILDGEATPRNAELAARLEHQTYHLRLTRDLHVAKSYLRERYGDNPDARYGLIASSRDRSLTQFGVRNDYQATKNVRVGPWYGDPEGSPRSCRRLEDAVTEFGAQGLELDAVLLAWGTDLLWTGQTWSNARASRYRRGAHVKDPLQLRLNAYRVLLTRGRDATVVYVPPLPELDATYAYLAGSGFMVLGSSADGAGSKPAR